MADSSRFAVPFSWSATTSLQPTVDEATSPPMNFTPSLHNHFQLYLKELHKEGARWESGEEHMGRSSDFFRSVGEASGGDLRWWFQFGYPCKSLPESKQGSSEGSGQGKTVGQFHLYRSSCLEGLNCQCRLMDPVQNLRTLLLPKTFETATCWFTTHPCTAQYKAKTC